MKIIGYLVFALGLVQCASTDKVQAPLGQWKLSEVKCENGSYTDAGKEIRAYYKQPNSSRSLVVESNRMVSTIEQREVPAKGIKPCKIVSDHPVVWEADRVKFLTGSLIKSSPSDKECQGVTSVKGGSFKAYRVAGDSLTFSRKGPVQRINPKDSSVLCRSGGFLSIYKRK